LWICSSTSATRVGGVTGHVQLAVRVILPGDGADGIGELIGRLAGLQQSFAIDNVVVSVVSIFIVLLVLLFTFQSVGMPLLLIVVIQGAIWLNFSFPYFSHTSLYFMGYLIVSSIQMGANIDYAIVIGTRFSELKDKMDHEQACSRPSTLPSPPS